MMTVREYASYLLAYWPDPAALVDNAPPALRALLGAIKADRARLHTAVALLAGSGEKVLPGTLTMAQWLVARPTTIAACDEILASKKPPKSWAELIERSYKVAHQETTDQVRAWIKQQIADN
jgi:hypothetical protein